MNDDLSAVLLKELYAVWWEHGYGGAQVVDEWAQEHNLDREAMYRGLEDLKEEELVRFRTFGTAEITSQGVMYAETNGLASDEQREHSEQARTRMLDVLAKVREEHGVRGIADWHSIIEQANIEQADFDRNYKLLEAFGLMEAKGMSMFSITKYGYEKILDWRKRTANSSQFDDLKTSTVLTPQKRGHELEKLLEQVLKEEGWECERNVRAPGEENDLVVHQEREYYLMESKWEKERTGTGQLRNLRDKVTSRPGVRGLYVSMAGYSSEAIEYATDRLESALVLLFGPGDIEAIMSHAKTFTELLNSKFHAAMSRKRIDVE